jgi:hypothetical protein
MYYTVYFIQYKFTGRDWSCHRQIPPEEGEPRQRGFGYELLSESSKQKMALLV